MPQQMHDAQFAQLMRQPEGYEEAMLPVSLENSFEYGMAVTARFPMYYGDAFVSAGTSGQVISQKGFPLVVRWHGIGDKPVVASQLSADNDPPHVGDDSADEEVFFYPKVFLNTEEQAPVQRNAIPYEAEAPGNKDEDLKAKDAEKGKGKGKGKKGKGKKGKVDVTV